MSRTRDTIDGEFTHRDYRPQLLIVLEYNEKILYRVWFFIFPQFMNHIEGFNCETYLCCILIDQMRILRSA